MTTNQPYGQPQDDAPQGENQWAPQQDQPATEAPAYGSEGEAPSYGSANEAPAYAAQPGYSEQQQSYGAQQPYATPPQQQPYTQAGYPAGGGGLFKQGQAIAVTIIGFFVFWVTMILGIVALVKGNDNPEQANKFVKWGWISLIIGAVLWIIGIILFFVLFAAAMSTATYSY